MSRFLVLWLSVLFSLRVVIDLTSDLRLPALISGDDSASQINRFIAWHDPLPALMPQSARMAAMLVLTTIIPGVLYVLTLGSRASTNQRLAPYMLACLSHLTSLLIGTLLLGPFGYLCSAIVYSLARGVQALSLCLFRHPLQSAAHPPAPGPGGNIITRIRHRREPILEMSPCPRPLMALLVLCAGLLTANGVYLGLVMAMMSMAILSLL